MNYDTSQNDSKIFRYEVLSLENYLPEPSSPDDGPKSPDRLLHPLNGGHFIVPPVQAHAPSISDPSNLDSDEFEFPEGGRQAWVTVFASACLIFLSQGSVSSFGVYQDYYTRVFLNEKTPSEIAWIGSMQLFLIFALGPVTGKLFDEGYIRHLLFIGSAIYLFSYFMLSLAKPHQYYQVFLAQGIGVGTGMGLLYLPSILICFHYFKRKRAQAAGFASLGGSVGAIVQTIGLNHVINGRVGFAWGVRIFGFIFLILAIIGNLLIRPRLPPRKLRKGNIIKPNIKKVITDITFLIIIIGASLIFFAIYFPFFYIQLFAILHGTSPKFAFYTITIINGANIVGRASWGVLGDKIGIINSVIIACSLLGIVSFTMIKATTVAGLTLFTIFYGFLSGGYFALAAPCISAIVEDVSDLGFALGYSTFIESFFVLIAEPVAGQLLDAPRYRWNRSIIFVSIILFIGVFFAVLGRWMLVKRKKTWKT